MFSESMADDLISNALPSMNDSHRRGSATKKQSVASTSASVYLTDPLKWDGDLSITQQTEQSLSEAGERAVDQPMTPSPRRVCEKSHDRPRIATTSFQSDSTDCEPENSNKETDVCDGVVRKLDFVPVPSPGNLSGQLLDMQQHTVPKRVLTSSRDGKNAGPPLFSTIMENDKAYSAAVARLPPTLSHLASLMADADGFNHGPSRHFQMLERCASKTGSPRPLYEGYLTKQGTFIRNWKRRWCIIDEEGAIRWYKPNEYIPRGVVRPKYDRPMTSPTGAVVGAGSRLPNPRPSVVLQGADAIGLTNWPRAALNGNRSRVLAIETNRNKFFFMFADSAAEANCWAGLINGIVDKS
eukprot:m.159671 g.159671  ORF g.159671 m.159671 type:complete len:354 (-) comp14535_c0_seq8:1460-2521(-)